MITSKEDLRFYIKEDFKRNIGKASFMKVLALRLYGTDGYKAFRYLKALRKYEYAINVQKRTAIGKLIWLYRKLVWHKLGVRYGLLIPPNCVGYGFKMSHVGGV